MALRIVDGVPGAGKTYFAVDHCLKSFYSFDESTDRWLPKDTETVLITNIESFAIGVQLETELESVGGDIEKYFNYEFLAARFDSKRVVFIIDEAQFYFHTKFSSQSVALFFQKHRHLGMDIYLVTQDAGLIAKSIRSLAEYVISAAKRTMSLFGEFRYNFSDPTTGQRWKTKVLKRDRRVFAVYRSMLMAETEEIKSVPLKFIGIIVLLIVTCVGGFITFVKYRYGSNAEAAALAKKAESSSKGQVASVQPGSIVAQNSGPVLTAPPEIGVFAILTGKIDFDGKVTFLVSVSGQTLRLDDAGLVRLCKCHSESLTIGSPFEAYGLAARGAEGRGPTSAPSVAAPKVLGELSR